MKLSRKIRLGITIGSAACALSLGLIIPTVSGASAPSGTITYAEGPGAAPDWIFPYSGFQYFSVANMNQFQLLMFRPLYFFGKGSSAAYVPSLSLGQTPVMTNGNKTITIKTKGWKFADGQTINAQSVMFFLNLYKADPTAYAGYVSGYGIPDEIVSASGRGNTVVIHMKSAVNPGWILYNYLSEITPFPNTWDKTSAHANGTCATGAFGSASTDASCKAVLSYLNAQSGKFSTYTSQFWQSGNDGPWRLTHFDDLGNATFQPNPKYMGPQKAQVKFVKEVAFTSTQAEENALQAGSIDLGFVDPTILTAPAPGPGKAGPNWGSLGNRYRLTTGTSFAFDYAPWNFTSSNPLQAVFQQLYFRQALTESNPQPQEISNILKGYGVVGSSPLPPNTASAISKTPNNPYPFSLSNAKALLTSHGWSEQGGVMTCTSPGTGAGNCGANVAQGATINFTFLYLSGYPSVNDTVNAMVADWGSIGIKVTAKPDTFNNLLGECAVNSGTNWSLCWWGGGWIYDPDFYPSGEELFLPGAGSNSGGYSNPTMNNLIHGDTVGRAPLTPYEAFAAQNLPVLYMYNQEGTGEVIKTLRSKVGFGGNPLQNFLPEYLSY